MVCLEIYSEGFTLRQGIQASSPIPGYKPESLLSHHQYQPDPSPDICTTNALPMHLSLGHALENELDRLTSECPSF